MHIEKLPEGVYLATSDDIPGLIAQGRAITETVEIARDIAKKLIEAQTERLGGYMLEGTLRAIIKQAGITTEAFLKS